MARYPELFILRHGQTEWNREGRHQGQLNSPLTDMGKTQAKAQGAILRDVLEDRAIKSFSSPQGRAIETAAIALQGFDVPIQDERLCEIGFGKWEGLTSDEIGSGWPESSQTADLDPFGWHFQADGGEPYDHVVRRVTEFLGGLSEPAVLVTHGITSRVLRGVWLGLEFDELNALPGGQGCVYHLKDGQHFRLPAEQSE